MGGGSRFGHSMRTARIRAADACDGGVESSDGGRVSSVGSKAAKAEGTQQAVDGDICM